MNTCSPLLRTVLLAASLCAPALANGPTAHGSPTAPSTLNTPTFTLDGGVELLLLRMGLNQEAFAASGVSASQFQALMASAETSVGQNGIEVLSADLPLFDAAVATARHALSTLRKAVQSGLATEEDVAELEAAQQAHDNEVFARQTYLDDARAELCALLPQAKATVLVQISTNSAWKDLPVQYLVKQRTSEQWVSIRDALASKRIFEEMEDEVPANALTILAEVDGDAAVASAKANCDSELAGIQTTWNAIFSE